MLEILLLKILFRRLRSILTPNRVCCGYLYAIKYFPLDQLVKWQNAVVDEFVGLSLSVLDEKKEAVKCLLSKGIVVPRLPSV